MDVNGTAFHLLLGEQDWLGPGVTVTPSDALAWAGSDHTVRFAEVPFEIPERAGDRRLSPADRRGTDVDRYGHLYWIGPGHDQVLFQPAGTREVRTYWPQPPGCVPEPTGAFVDAAPGTPPAARFAGLAVTVDHHLVVGVPAVPAVLVFDLHGGGPPVTVPWPQAFAPVDIVTAPGGGVWVLDLPDHAASARLWRLDGLLRVRDLSGVGPAGPPRSPDFRPTDPEAPVAGDPGRGSSGGDDAPGAGSPVEVVATDPIALAGLPDGTVLVLDRGADGQEEDEPATAPVLRRLDGAVQLGPELPIPAGGGPPHDLAYLPEEGGEGVAGTVYVVGEQGAQTVAWALSADGQHLDRLHRYLPMRLFSGRALVAGGGVVRYDLGDRWLPLVDRRTRRYRTTASLVTGDAGGPDGPGPFDARVPRTVWHRLALDARIPSGTSVTVAARAADAPEVLAALPWQEQPAPYRRDGESEVAYHRFAAPDTRDAGTFELLFQGVTGRYLQLRLTLTGDGRRTPALWALRAHAPRFSYLDHYLPGIYAEDPDNAGFLDRYLANVEGMCTTIEGRIAAAQVLFGADTPAGEHLDWLAGWLGLAVDRRWEQWRVRLLLAHAVTMAQRRGTVRGLLEAVRLATDDCPDATIFRDGTQPVFGVRIVEAFRRRSVPAVALGDPGDLTGPRLVPERDRWVPADGRSELDRRYRAWVTATHGTPAQIASAWDRPIEAIPTDAAGAFHQPFPPLTPSGDAEARDWIRFVTDHLAVPYAEVTAADLPRYQRFLSERHRRIEALNDAWGRVGSARFTAFAAVGLPSGALPTHPQALTDWLVFVTTVLSAARAAHRFTVLVPIRPEDPDAVREDRLARVAEVVARERPAHTAFDVRPYWAALRVGEARVGIDTVVGQGSRTLAMVLGDGRLAAAHLRGRHPFDVPDRFVVGRERLGASHASSSRPEPPARRPEPPARRPEPPARRPTAEEGQDR